MGASGVRLLRRLDIGHAVPLLALLLEVLWAYGWFAWVSTRAGFGSANPPLNLGGAVALAVAVEAVTRLALARDWSLLRVRSATLLTALLLLAAVVRLEMDGGYALWDVQWAGHASRHITPLAGGLAFGAYLTWRGISIGRETLSFDELYSKFLTGLAALVVLLILWSGTSGFGEIRIASGPAELYLVAYFSVGLVGLAIIRLVATRREMLLHDETSGSLSRRWLSLIMGVTLAILVVATGISSVFSADTSLLLSLLDTLANWLLLAFLYGIVYPVGFIAAGLTYLLRFLASLFGLAEPPQIPSPPDFSGLEKAVEEQGHQGLIPPEAVLILKGVLVALVVLLVIFLLARALFRYRRSRPDEGVEEVSESIWSWSEIRGDLLSLFARLLHWLLRRRARRPAPSLPPASATLQDDDDSHIFPVRELYRGLLWEGQRAGFPRRPAATPYEYQDILESRLAAGVPELEALTRAYVAERYGPAQTGAEGLALLNRLWRHLRSRLRGEQGKS